MNTDKIGRREFVKLMLAGSVVLFGPKLPKMGNGRSEAESESTHQWAMVIDQEKCIGCGDCLQACHAHNDVAPDMTWNRLIETDEPGTETTTWLPVQCMHCEHPPCVGVCPVKATYQRSDGIVMMDYERCIGCRYCELACPYGARSFNWQAFKGENPTVPEWGEPEVERRPRGVVEKCSFCVQRIDRGLSQGLTPGVDREATPACVNACPVGARIFGDLNDPESAVSKALSRHPAYRLRENSGVGPRIYYLAPDVEDVEEPLEVS